MHTDDSGVATQVHELSVQPQLAPTSAADRRPTIIRPERGWLDWRLGQLWRYRDLIGLFVWRDFVSLYKQTILGPLWHIIQPLLTTLMFTLVFSRVAGLSTDGVPPFLFYMVGSVAWGYFANCVNGASKTFLANTGLLGKVYFHRLVIPVAIVLSNLTAFAIQLGIFLVVLLWYRASGATVQLTPWILAAPLLVIMLGGYGLGAGTIVAAMTTKYRDLGYLVSFGVQLAMYATPVIYPTSSVPARYRWLMSANPLAPIIEGLRRGFLGVGTVSVAQVAGSFALMLALMAAAVTLFTRVERTFMDTV